MNSGLKPIASAVAVLSASLALLPMPVFGQTSTNADSTGQAPNSTPEAKSQSGAAQANQQTVTVPTIVVGTRRSDVTPLTSSSPVDVITAKQLEETGATNLAQALQARVPSLNFPGNRASTLSTATKQASLRGLSPDETLVLVNGKRWHPSAAVNTGDSFGRGSQAVDLAAIPISAIKRVEVLRDGASAQYGSDAVAGVINIVLKDYDEGGEISTQVGNHTSDGGLSKEVSFWKGFSLPNHGFFTLSGSWDKQNFVPLNSGVDTRCYYCATSTYPVAAPGKEATAPGRNWDTGNGANGDLALMASAELPLSDWVSLYAFANYSKRYTDGVSPWRLPNSSANVAAVTPDGYQVIGRAWPEDVAVQGGVRFGDDLFGHFDLGLGYGESMVNMYSDSENPSYGVNTPTHFYLGELKDDQTNLTLDWNRKLDLPFTYKPLTLSAGVAERWESYDQSAGDPASYSFGGVTGVPIGVTGGGFIPPSAAAYDKSRNIDSAYIGLEGEIIRNLTLGAAFREEHYSDFGQAPTFKLSGRYEFSPQLAVRATWNTAFKAPTIGQQSLYQDTPVQINPTAANPSGRVDTLLIPASSALAKLTGASDLQPEKSHNVSADIVLTPTSNTSLTVDAYHITIQNRIGLSNVVSGGQVSSILAAAGYPTVYGVQYFTNIGSTTTNGVDVVGNYDTRLWRGHLHVSAAYSYNDTKFDNLSNKSFAGSQLVNYSTVTSLFMNAVPRQRVILNEDYRLANWEVSSTQTWYGRYGGANNQAPGQQAWFKSALLVDLTATYNFNKHLSTTVGVNNLFDVKPEMVWNSANGGRLSNSSLAAWDAAGTWIYGNLTYRF